MSKEAMKLALDRAAPTSKGYVIVPDDAFQVIKEALAQPEQEPVAHTAVFHCPNCEYPHRQVTHITGVAQPPWSPQRTWVGLTDEELADAWPFEFRSHELGNKTIYQAIETKLKEKNYG
jgi:hypothetical protein